MPFSSQDFGLNLSVSQTKFHETFGPLTFEVAGHAEILELTRLINGAYRGEEALRLSWSTEADLLSGQRIDPTMLTEQLSRKDSFMLCGHVAPNKESVGCVALERLDSKTCYLGTLTVRVDQQNRGYGDLLLKAGERFAVQIFGAESMRMTVLMQRPELISWYERRGYVMTDEQRPFPYGDERFGKPLRDDLRFVIMTKDL